MRRSNRLDFTKREETRNAKGNDGVVIRRLCHPTCIEFQSIEPQLYRWIEFLVPRCQLSNAGPVTLCKFNADRFGWTRCWKTTRIKSSKYRLKILTNYYQTTKTEKYWNFMGDWNGNLISSKGHASHCCQTFNEGEKIEKGNMSEVADTIACWWVLTPQRFHHCSCLFMNTRVLLQLPSHCL